ncbi:alpha-L-rhamnosidase C-terminal domain-containing protein [Streptomyces sp. enrichment culture]|uniref:alpha-L-rhamnosidase C-terminal domain-containing protein n=1 Tax=Streptomyces sp. enrichment culture TaxID=1795815 RepID=UPI003F572481
MDIAPRPGGGLTSTDASIVTPYGTACVAWSISGDTLTVDISLPPGTTGRFSAPEGWRCPTGVGRLGSCRHHLTLHTD